MEEAEAYAAELELRASLMEAADAGVTATPSGAEWVNRFPESTALKDLTQTDKLPFRENVTKFIEALKRGGHKPVISTTWRPLERQYLMHYAWVIANGWPKSKEHPEGLPPLNPTLTNPPPMKGVDICWVHRNAKGEIDIAASRKAAQEMVGREEGYAIASFPADPTGPEGPPRHVQGRAIDMSISWTGDLVLDGEVIPGGTGDPTKDGWNPRLVQLAKEKYGLTKGGGPTDWPHWSDDGK